MFYDPATGKLLVSRDGVTLGTWTDSTPLITGAYLSLRTDSASVQFDDVAVSDVVKYYALGGTRIAMRKAGAVSYLLGDHPSTALRTGSRLDLSGLQCVYQRDSNAALQAMGRDPLAHGEQPAAENIPLHRATRGCQHRAVLLWRTLLRRRAGTLHPGGYDRAESG